MADGDKHCQRCGKYLGNYNTGNYYSLIRKKYCDICRRAVKNEQNLYSKKQNRKPRKKLLNELQEQITLIREENELLRKKNKLLTAEIKKLKGEFKG